MKKLAFFVVAIVLALAWLVPGASAATATRTV